MDLRCKPPADATPEGIRKAEELILLPQIAKTKSGVRPQDLEVICLEYDPKPSQRFIPGRGSKLRNKAFLIALILKGMGHDSAIMPEWWTPADTVPPTGKRDGPEPPSDGSTATELDWDNLTRYATVFVCQCGMTLMLIDLRLAACPRRQRHRGGCTGIHALTSSSGRAMPPALMRKELHTRTPI